MTDYTYTKETGDTLDHQDLDAVMMKKEMANYGAKKDYYASMKHGKYANHSCTGWHSAIAIFTWLFINKLSCKSLSFFGKFKS